MKRILLSVAIWLGLATAMLTMTPVQVRAESLQDLPPSVIDNIEVPYDVVMYAQMEYQGFAITKVSKTTHDRKQAYQLRVDRDSSPDDFKSIYLYYDKDWDLMDDDKMTKPEAAAPEERDVKKDESNDDRSGPSERPAYKPEPEVREPDDDSAPDNPDPPAPEPEPTPTPEPTPEPEQPPADDGAPPQ